jgi:hypothetical protein
VGLFESAKRKGEKNHSRKITAIDHRPIQSRKNTREREKTVSENTNGLRIFGKQMEKQGECQRGRG